MTVKWLSEAFKIAVCIVLLGGDGIMRLQYPKVSILMPSLNSGAFIRECMDSVVNQALQDIEIICIDAGSTDGTLDILREYEKIDPRVRIIISDKKSMGYQYNLGLDAANGDYIGMVETDDWIEADTFEKLWSAASRQDVDIVAANQYLYYTKPEIHDVRFENLSRCPYEQVFCPKDVLHSFAVKPLIWSAIYRRSMLKENNIRFNETPGASFQDTSFHYMVMTVAKTAFFLDQYFYHYRSDSETQSINSGGKVYCLCDEEYYYEQFLEGRPSDKKLLFKPHVTWKYDKYYWNYCRIAPQFQWEFLMRFRDEFLEYRKAGLLQETPSNTSGYNFFRKGFHEIIDNPVSFYKTTCKKYCTIPKNGEIMEAQVLKEGSLVSPDVSIIIPLCNEESRVTDSLESARKQTLKNVEIICVDDGSDDDTLRIIMEQADTDQRLTVLHQGNQGTASAKNKGLAYARGRYVMFLYAGDRLREDAAECLTFLADKHRLDIVSFNFEPLYEKGVDGRAACNHVLKTEKVMTGADSFCFAWEQGAYVSFVCSAFYNRDYLARKRICFIDEIFYEDIVFMFSALTEADRVLLVEESIYSTGKSRGLPLKKYFLRVYSYFVIYQAILQKCRTLPYDEKLQMYAAKELKAVYTALLNIYCSVDKKEKCRGRFSAAELDLLDKLIDQKLDF